MKAEVHPCQNSHINSEHIPCIKIIPMPEQQTEASEASVAVQLSSNMHKQYEWDTDPPKPLSEEKMKELFNKLDLSGTETWEETEKREMDTMLTENSLPFALDDLGKTSIVKHKIKLADNEPFKEHYRRIPPHHHQFKEVRKHLQEMLDIGVIS